MNPRLCFLLKRASWYMLALLFALVLNFILPRLGPVGPVDLIISNMNVEGMSTQQIAEIRDVYRQAFFLDRPLFDQFIHYAGSVLSGDLGISSFSYPRTVGGLISTALPWTLALVLPAILLAWIVGNFLGVFTAFKRGIYERIIYPVAMFLASIPFFCLGLLFLSVFYVELGWVQSLGTFNSDIVPGWTGVFLFNALSHYWLPFLSIFLVIMSVQAMSVRSLVSHERGSTYVQFAQSMGVKERYILYYIFRNAMLPQLTGLAVTLGTIMGGSLITEIIFSYPGMGSLLFSAIRNSDVPLIQGITLLITLGVLLLNFTIDVMTSIFDPRIHSDRKWNKI